MITWMWKILRKRSNISMPRKKMNLVMSLSTGTNINTTMILSPISRGDSIFTSRTYHMKLMSKKALT